MLPILTLGDERLRKHSIVVPDLNGAINAIITQMFESMQAGKGIGLSAVQVGNPYRIFVTDLPQDTRRVFVNPEIVATSIEQGAFEEGCLSIPGIEAEVVRPLQVRVQAWNEQGKLFALDAEALLARVIQHELDHLNGVLFIDRIDPKKRERLVKQFKSGLKL
jgi:peptide deformylase